MDADAVHRAWQDRTGEFSPDYYAHHGPNATSELLRAQLDATVGPSATVLEIGCSAGRHLAHLKDHGYRDLWGVDINPEAGTVLRQAYPELWTTGTFRFDAIEEVIPTFEDRQFDAVYSVETLQHIPLDHEWVFAELARITEAVLITAEVESGPQSDPAPSVKYVDEAIPLYRRDWQEVFTPLGFVQLDSQSVGRDTLRVFERGSA